MKINKKIVCLAAAAAMSLSAVGASAAIVPQAGNAEEAFTMAESFYYDGLYYESWEALNQIANNWPQYNENKRIAWQGRVQYAIKRLEVKDTLKRVSELADYGFYAPAQDVLAVLSVDPDLTQDEYYSVKWWEEYLAKKLATTKSVVLTGDDAIFCVSHSNGGKIDSDYEWYCPVKVGDGYHVYIQTYAPDGTIMNVAAWQVKTNGTTFQVAPFAPTVA